MDARLEMRLGEWSLRMFGEKYQDLSDGGQLEVEQQFVDAEIRQGRGQDLARLAQADFGDDYENLPAEKRHELLARLLKTAADRAARKKEKRKKKRAARHQSRLSHGRGRDWEPKR